LPLIIAVAASGIIGLCVRGIFIGRMNRRLNQPYRYTGGDASSESAPEPNKKTARRGADKARERVDSASASANPPPPEPQASDSLALYRNLLGLRPGFTSNELKAAYHDAAVKYHPDRYAAASRRDRENAEALMKQINEAYAILKAV
jgi:hypothetical protein